MKILLVEDDEDKREQLTLFINEYIPLSDLTDVRSFQSGLKAIKSQFYELVLLDMTMPTFDISPTESGGRTQPFGGEMLLQEMVRREINAKVIVVTQFDLFGKGDEEIRLKDLDQRLFKQFEDNYLGAVQYSITFTSWKDSLLKKIQEAKLLD